MLFEPLALSREPSFLDALLCVGALRSPHAKLGGVNIHEEGSSAWGMAAPLHTTARAMLQQHLVVGLMSIHQISGCHSRNRLLFMGHKCFTRQGRHDESTLSPL